MYYSRKFTVRFKVVNEEQLPEVEDVLKALVESPYLQFADSDLEVKDTKEED